MNYLFQLSQMCANGDIKNAEPASRFYARQVVAISKKTVQRIEPGIKRKICKSCHQFLVPGKTCRIRVKKKVVIHQCLVCKAKKSFLTTPGYILWNERPEAVAELLDYRQNTKEADIKLETKPPEKKTEESGVDISPINVEKMDVTQENIVQETDIAHKK